jgi:uncharacterized Zn ribbon protein
MKTFKITTFERVHINKQFLYTVEATDAKEAKGKLLNGDYEDVLHIKDLNTLEIKDGTSIQNIKEEEQ